MTKEEIKEAKRKIQFEQEQVFDDCGSDTGPIEDSKQQLHMSTNHYDVDDIVESLL